MAYDGSLSFDTKIDQSGFNTGLKSLGTAASKGLKTIGVAIGAVATGMGVLIKQGVAYNSQMEQYITSFGTMLGSAEKAQLLVNDLKKFAAETPLEMGDLAKNAQTLLAFGIAADKIMPSLQAIGDVALGDSERMSSLTLAFAQCQSTGKLMGQDLLQMINAGFNPLNEISKMTGKSVATLKDEMSKGAISADMVAEAFKHATSEGGQFYGAMEAQSKTFAGRMSTLKDNWKSFLGGVTTGLTNSLKDTALPLLNNFLTQAQKAFSKGGFGGLVKSAGDIMAQAVAKITSYAPKIMSAGTSVIKSFLDGLKKNAKEITSGAAATVKSFIAGVLDMLPSILDAGGDLLSGLLSGFGDALPGLIPKAVESLISAFVELLSDAGKFLEAGFKIVEGVVLGIINAIPKLLKGVGDLFSSIFLSEVDAQKIAAEEAAGLTGVVENTAKRMTEIQNDFTNSLAEASAKNDFANKLIDQLEELQSKTSLTKDEQLKLAGVMSQLNALYPDLGLGIDEVTGELNMSTAALRNNVKQQFEAAKAAAYIEKYKKNIEAMVDVEIDAQKAKIKLAAAENKITTARNRAADAAEEAYMAEYELNEARKSGDYSKIAAAEANYSSRLEMSTKATEDLNRVIGEQQPIIDGATGAYNDLNGQLGAYNDENEMLIGMYPSVSEGISEVAATAETSAEQVEPLIIAGRDLTQAWQESGLSLDDFKGKYTGYLDALTKGVETSDFTFAKMRENYLNYIKTQNNLNGNMAKLKLVFSDNLSDAYSVLEHYVELFPEEGAALAADLSAMLEAGTPEAAAKAQELITMMSVAMAGEFTTTKKDTSENASDTVEGITKAVEAETPNTETAAKDLVKSAYNAAYNQNSGLNWNGIGRNMVQGVINGVGSMAAALSARMRKLAKDAESSFRRTLDINSPSKVFAKIGLSIPEGAALGIDRGEPLISRAIGRMENTVTDVDFTGQSTAQIVPASVSYAAQLSGLMQRLDKYLPALSGMQVVMDTGEVVGALAGPMDAAFGTMRSRRRF